MTKTKRKSIHMTPSMRNCIIDNATAGMTHHKESEKLRGYLAKAQLSAFKQAYCKELKIYSKLPDSWQINSGYTRADVDVSFSLVGNDNGQEFRRSVNLRCRASLLDVAGITCLPALRGLSIYAANVKASYNHSCNTATANRINFLIFRLYELSQEVRDIHNQLWDVLHGVRTTKQLLEVWPEAEKFIPWPEALPEPEPEPKPTPLDMSGINKTLGIKEKSV